ncbi:MAG: hypothetical protein ACK5AZ_16785 [Bryobacteraceae bacterium]
MTELIRNARRRQIVNLLFEQATSATVAAMCAVIVLLLVGTQILNWYWLLIVFAGSLGFGISRLRRQAPSPYEVAQQIDRRMNLDDALSTAYFYSQESWRRAATPESIREFQHAKAEDAARRIAARDAVPFTTPGRIYAAGGLVLLAFGMLALRYGVTRSLDLGPPIAQIRFENLFAPFQTAAKTKAAKEPRKEEPFEQLAVPVEQRELEAHDGRESQDGSAVSDAPDGEIRDTRNAKMRETAAKQGDEMEEADEGEQGGESGQEGGNQELASNQQNRSDSRSPQSGSESMNSESGPESSLLQKMRDAMASMMSKLNTTTKQRTGQQSASNRNSLQQRRPQEGAGQQGGMPMPSPSGQQSQRSSEQQGAQQGEGGEKSDSPQGSQSQQNAERQAQQEARTGMGKQDGNKDVKAAEQLEAMGKISEIIGKRSENVTGEMMVEVTSSRQQLRTPYTRSQATHQEAGGEIHRDEVPLALQPFVQQYFEQIRKAPIPEAQVNGSGSQ